MQRRISRRDALRTGVAAAAGITLLGPSVFRARRASAESVDALVIGSGFGGAIASLRLAEAGIQTVVLERGRRWPITPQGDTFAPAREPDGRAWWLRDSTFFEGVLGQDIPIDRYTGVLEYKQANGIGILRGAGVGGGSLVYNAMQYQPTREHFLRIFPEGIDYDEMDRVYYPRVRSVQDASPIPDDILQTSYYRSTRLILEQAAAKGLPAHLLDLAVDWDIVREEIAGTRRPSAIAGDAWYGINSGAKNSLDHNYLAMAEASGYVDILPLHEVQQITQAAGGGYSVAVNEIDETGGVVAQKTFVAKYLFLAAGSVGTSELLVRAKARGDLPALNDEVGRGWGSNGDIFHIWTGLDSSNPGEGGPAGAVIEHFDNPVSPFVVENVPLWFIPDGTMMTLAMGIGSPVGEFTYDGATDTVTLNWPADDPRVKRVLQAAEVTYDILNPERVLPPADNVAPHPLGGAVLGRATDMHGRVKGYSGLYVVDGALIPGYAGAVNPSFTIAALAERCMESIIPELGKA